MKFRVTSCLWLGWVLCCLLSLPGMLVAGEHSTYIDKATGWTIHVAKQGKTQIKLAPAAGCNVYSIVYDGRELLRQPPELKELPGFRYGNPVLYPMPNRVKDSEFTLADRKYSFPPNNGKNFLHGLVHSAAWEVIGGGGSPDKVTIECALTFEQGKEWYRLFPHRHRLLQTITVTDSAVAFEYTVDNTDGDKPVPFGLAYHPWLLYQGKREETFLTIPATHWMEAVEQLPTGKLVELDGSKFDARQPHSLQGFVIDDVYFGMKPEKPVTIDFRDANLKMEFSSSAEFTHLVVYTPEEPWFCVENQTCATDAHNLHARGLKEEAHLQIVERGQKKSGKVQFKFSSRE